MITRFVIYPILLLSGLVYAKDFDVDTSLVDRVILTVVERHECSRWPHRYCISEKKDIQNVIKSYLRAEPSDIPFGLADSIITFVTKDKNNRMEFHNYFLPKGQHDSVLSYYLDLTVNKPNWYQFKIVSDRFDLFDTTLNYLKANYNVDSAYDNKVKITAHRIRFKTKDYIEESDEYKFKDLLERIDKKPFCIITEYIGARHRRCCKNRVWEIIPEANIYFPCINVYGLAEVLKYLYTFKWIEIAEVEIKNYFEIKFWAEINPNRPGVRNIMGDELDEITLKMKAAGITFSEIRTVVD